LFLAQANPIPIRMHPQAIIAEANDGWTLIIAPGNLPGTARTHDDHHAQHSDCHRHALGEQPTWLFWIFIGNTGGAGVVVCARPLHALHLSGIR
jgi:hypothetical protein